MRSSRGFLAFAGICAFFAADAVIARPPQLTVKLTDELVEVSADGAQFFNYIFKGRQKPVIYPIIGPDGVPMTRSYPLKADVDGEPKDHIHHESLWFTYGKVNGENFWAPGKTRITGNHPPKVETSGNTVTIRAANDWLGQDGETVVCTDSEVISGAVVSDDVRTIDYTKTITASHGPVTFHDDKEGLMAIRVNPAFQANRTGTLVNSDGISGKDAWGKNARWVDCSGPIDGKIYGIAVFDHPSNLRFPTTWHARDYGLIGANPFGLSQFQGKPPGTGDYTIPQGRSLTLRYRFVFHRGNAKQADIDNQFREWEAASVVTYRN